MKRQVLALSYILSILILSGCVVNEDEHTELHKDFTLLQEKHTKLQEKFTSLQKNYTKLQQELKLQQEKNEAFLQEIDFYKNGANMQLVAIKNAFENYKRQRKSEPFVHEILSHLCARKSEPLCKFQA